MAGVYRGDHRHQSVPQEADKRCQHLLLGSLALEPCSSKGDLRISSVSNPWKLVRNAESRAPPWTCRVRIWIVTDLCAREIGNAALAFPGAAEALGPAWYQVGASHDWMSSSPGTVLAMDEESPAQWVSRRRVVLAQERGLG